MERSYLVDRLAKGMSLAQIGAEVGKDPSTVSYWLRRHGLEANGRDRFAARGGLERDQLEPLVLEGRSLAEIAAELDRSVSTVRHWLGVHGLRTDRAGRGRTAAAREALARGERRMTATCQHHGEVEFLIFAGGRSRCSRCNAEAVVRRRRAVKAKLIEEAGGRCAICGYRRCRRALEFHHVDPARKSFGVSERGIARSLQRAREEVSKCVLLCANCHAEVEDGIAALP